MTLQRFDCDVLVVGLGPVGAALAALLARRGVSTLAIDKEVTPYPLPRAVHFDHEIMRIFQELGIAGRVEEFAEPAQPYEFRTADGQLLLSVNPGPTSPSGWASNYLFHQPSLEAALRELLAAHPNAGMRLGWRFEALVEDAEGVTATISGPAGAATIRSRYLVGCDGASSPVRTALGGGMFDYGFDEPWLVVDVNVASDSRLPEVNLQICDPERPTTCVYSGPGRHRWEFMLLPGETPQAVLQDDFIAGLLSPWKCRPVEIERRAVYRFHALTANRWRRGRVLLAGDAAHQTPPFAGQGMCSGIRDAANLAWKLAAILAGHAGEALLDTYQTEREPHARALIELAMGMGRIVCTQDRAAAAARDREMLAQQAAGAVAPPLGGPPIAAGLILAGSPGAGEIFPQPTFGEGRIRLRLDEALGSSGWLICRRRSGVVRHPELDVRSVEDPTLAPFQAALANWLDARGAEAVLVRPDRYVFGTGAPEALALAWARTLRPSQVDVFDEMRSLKSASPAARETAP